MIRQITLVMTVLTLPILSAGQARAFDQAMADRVAAVRECCGKLFHYETDYERCVARAFRTAEFNAFLDRDRTPLRAAIRKTEDIDPFALTPPCFQVAPAVVQRKRGTSAIMQLPETFFRSHLAKS